MLLAALSYHFRDDEHQKPPYEVCFKCAKLPTVQKTALASTANSMLTKLWASRTQRKPTAQDCQDKVSQAFIVPASLESLSDIVGQEVKRWMPPHCRRILGDYPRSQEPVISIVLETACSALPVYLGNILLRSLMGLKTKYIESHS